jgi:ribosomal protein L11 methyltransferase
VELAPEGFEETQRGGEIELAAYGESAHRVLAALAGATAVEVDDDWSERWREFHRPVRLGPLWIGPPWESPPTGALPVVIDPGRAFGTGAHPSTRLCLELLLGERVGSLVDIGTGSGVIAIAAARLGFHPVSAIDVDGTAIEVAVENARANGVELAARTVDDPTAELPHADLAVANISLEAIEAIAAKVTAERWITAGYLARDRPNLDSFRHVERRELDGWAADLSRHGRS